MQAIKNHIKNNIKEYTILALIFIIGLGLRKYNIK